MERFLDEELELNEKVLLKSITIKSLAGKEYNRKIKELDNTIDIINKRNANAYQKSKFCSII